MTARYDAKTRTLSCSVHDLLSEPPRERFSLSGGAFWGRMQLGARVHQAHQMKQEATLFSYRREVPVDYTAILKDARLPETDGERGEVTLRVLGRIDGAFEREGLLVVEEIKSLLLPKEALPHLSAERRAPFEEQVTIYALILHAQGEPAERIRTELVLISALDGGEHRLPVAWQARSVEDLIHGRARALLDELARLEARRRARAALAAALPFPFPQFRPGQREMVEALQAANQERVPILVHAPTGVGKTAAALWVQTRAALAEGGVAFAVTAKNTQREVFLKTASRWEEAGHPVRVVALRAKAKLCANDVVVCHPDVCPYAQDYEQKITRHNLPGALFAQKSVWSPDDLFAVGKEAGVCPFELALDATLEADVVVCDYNYVFDPQVALKRFFDPQFAPPGLKVKENRLVIDEAHNLVSRGREYYSPSLSRAALKEAQKAAPAGPFGKKVRKLAGEILSYLDDLSQEATGGRGGWAETSFDPERFSAWREIAELLVGESLVERKSRLEAARNEAKEAPPSAKPRRARRTQQTLNIDAPASTDGPSVPEDPVLTFLFEVIKFESVLALGEHPALTHLVFTSPDGSGDMLKILCRDAGPWLAKRHASFATVVAMSGTLSPFAYYEDTLGLAPYSPRTFAVKNPFPPENLAVFVEPTVDTSFRFRERYARRIATLIYEASRQRAGNYLVAFPSYAYLETVARYWEEFSAPPDILLQEREMSEAARQKLLHILTTPAEGPRLLCAVTGGVFSEGVDFAGDLLLGAFVVGPSLPRYDTENELIKRYFDEKRAASLEEAGEGAPRHSADGFAYAYRFPGMTRVIQAAGRVIRTPEDVGFVALLCRRFLAPEYRALFPAHWEEESSYGPVLQITRDLVGGVAEFWERHGRVL